MLIRRPSDITPSEITDPDVFATRRHLIRNLLLGSTALAFGRQAFSASGNFGKLLGSPYSLSDYNPTPLTSVTIYGNFYEFGPDKDSPAKNAHRLRTRPWQLTVDVEVKQAKTFDIDDLLRLAPRD